ncbi:ER membrane fusion/vesicular trafficking t-SNARE integral membrane protein, putative [Candida maltosa Xu316]|uniref:ER membrane fusion/vesicular trafficking t-SNARE integral membrane protein, putative n=1 Tax=Candida maltosa (strain Xu316) TaxID=1245528 RepID=M3JXH6_CANMX|nr:ER membrane fusion/vesicular trafficking t-SNARE integral membrane protein, putative [Candida maltosa Xu316]
MTDLTPLFKQCVDIVQSEYKSSTPQKHIPQPPYILEDTFLKESREFFQVLTNLNQFIDEIKSDYLAITDDTHSSSKNSGSLSMEDKNKLDEEFNYKVQAMYKKLNHLESYETKRQDLIPQTSKTNTSSSGWFGFLNDDEPSDQDVYYETVFSHRKQILRFLMDSLNNINRKFESIQSKRRARERQLNLLNFQNFDDDDDDEEDEVINGGGVDYRTLDQIQQTPEYLDDADEVFDQQQLQELELENQEFLNMKTNQLKQVEKVQKSIVDIINIQNELGNGGEIGE